MKYFIFTFLWRQPGEAGWNSETGVRYAEDITRIYEYCYKQPEVRCITSIVEISEEEFNKAKERGIIS